ncbi:hypothetical protein EAY16_20530, partial [Vibrio anguillarum]|nr:hypothetical protein [Vibrio anguillarum]
MLNHAKSVGYGSSLFLWLFSFEFVGKLASVGAVFWTIILWRWKFSELPQSIFGQARGWGGWLNKQSDLSFLELAVKVQSLIFKIMSHFCFLRFWFLFVN